MLSLSWGDQPLPSEIMRTLISIPEFFSTEDLYTGLDQKSARYTFKGMICFQAAHYLSFFRRMAMKFEYLDIDYNTQEQDIRALQNEVTTETEWTLFDDANVESMGDW